MSILLTPWQQTQAAMLTQYASFAYLEGLYNFICALREGRLLPIPDTARVQSNTIAGMSRGSAWQRYDWTFLEQLQVATAGDLALRAEGRYRPTIVAERLMNAYRTAHEYMGADEANAFDLVSDILGSMADRLDRSFAWPNRHRWDDFTITLDNASHIPVGRCSANFVPNQAVVCSTGSTVPCSGIYVVIADERATPQFAWAGDGAPSIPSASTFNELGLEALELIGRDDLWLKDEAMTAFAECPHIARLLRTESGWEQRDAPGVAASLVARHAFKTIPATWMLIEQEASSTPF